MSEKTGTLQELWRECNQEWWPAVRFGLTRSHAVELLVRGFGGEVEDVGRNGTVQKITPDAKAGEASAELVRRGVAADARVRALVEVVGEGSDLPPMAAVVEAGGAFDRLADEPDLYTDADRLRPRAG